jgi:hypothetical protein
MFSILGTIREAVVYRTPLVENAPMRTMPILPVLVLLAACAATGPEPEERAAPPARIQLADGVTVSREGERVRYVGELTEEGFAALRQVSEGHPVRTLVITSAGGEINAGMDFGEWAFERRVDLEVDEICLSSCANYIFPAARNKLIRAGAVVAWHGSARQRGLMAQLERDIDGRLRSLAGPQRDHERQRMRRATADYLERSQRRQDAFFQRIRVEEFVTRIGAEEYGVNDLYFLSVEDMYRFGITNVIAPRDYAHADLSSAMRRHQVRVLYVKLKPFQPCQDPGAHAAAGLASLDTPRCAGVGR